MNWKDLKDFVAESEKCNMVEEIQEFKLIGFPSEYDFANEFEIEEISFDFKNKKVRFIG